MPQPGAPNYATINQYTVQQGDRLDLIAAKYLGDPLMAWLICDANGAMRPDDLVDTPGHGAGHHHAAGRAGRQRVLSSVQLTLMMGPVIPLTVPRAVLDALVDGRGEVDDVGPSGFQLVFSIDKQSPLQILFLLTGGLPLLFMRCILVATVNGVANVLIDGVITNNQISPGDKGSNSTLTHHRQGSDRADGPVELERLSLPGLPARGARGAAARQVRVLRRDAADHSQRPDRHPAADRPDPQPAGHRPATTSARWPSEVGYVFYIDAGPGARHEHRLLGAADQSRPGAARAQRRHGRLHQRREPALHASIRRRTRSRWSTSTSRRPASASRSRFRRSRRSIRRSALIPPLPTNLLPPISTPFRDDLSKLPIPQAIMMGLAAAAQNAEVVTCEGSLDVTRYGGVLKRAQAGRACAAPGPAFDGLYYVKSVTHKIKRGEYKQNFTLTRNGLVSTVPTVNP